jgi:hypothetical protein
MRAGPLDQRPLDGSHPVMRLLGAFFDTAVECGLTKAETSEVAEATLAACAPGEKRITELMTDAFAERLEEKGTCDGLTYRRLVGIRLAPLMRECEEDLRSMGIESREEA